jgi:hypothetical protein
VREAFLPYGVRNSLNKSARLGGLQRRVVNASNCPLSSLAVVFEHLQHGASRNIILVAWSKDVLSL